MYITVNDKAVQIDANTTITQLLDSMKVSGPVAVELNRQVCPKRLHAETIINDQDVLEIVTIVGGG